MPFNQMMNFPVELKRRTTPDGLRLCPVPVQEIEKLHRNEKIFKKKTIKPGKNLLSGFSGDFFDIDVDIDVSKAERVGFTIRDKKIVYDARGEKLRSGRNTAPLKTSKGRIQLRILVDKTSIEIFANEGEIYMPLGAVPTDETNQELAFFVKGGTAEVKSLAIREMKSI